jgi:hypothetical protein
MLRVDQYINAAQPRGEPDVLGYHALPLTHSFDVDISIT